MTVSAMSSNSSSNHNNGPPIIKAARPEILTGIRNFLNGSSYREVIESSSSYNNNIVHERKLRLPYLDSQTGVAQSDCHLWFNRNDRKPGTESGQLYTYPAKRWKKKRRQYLMNDSYLTRGRQTISHSSDIQLANFDHDSNSNLSNDGFLAQVIPKSEAASAAANEATNGNSSKFGFHRDDSKDSWYDYDDGSDLPDAGELDEDSDFDDYDEYTTSRRKKKAKEKTPRRKRNEYSDAEKPFACEVCGARYKTRPGLSYHYTHSHQVENPELLVQPPPPSEHIPEQGGIPFTPPRLSQQPGLPHLTGPGAATNQGQPSPGLPAMTAGTNPGGASRASPLPSSVSNAGATTGTESPNTTASSASSQDGFAGNRPAGKGTVAPPQDYCDFCLGDTAENKKTKSAESLVSCSDCGRSAHPTCLQFTPNMIASVKKYRWQCIECKSCGLCGTSDNDVSDVCTFIRICLTCISSSGSTIVLR